MHICIQCTIVMQEGEADVSCDRGNGNLTKGSCVLIKDGEKYVLCN